MSTNIHTMSMCECEFCKSTYKHSYPFKYICNCFYTDTHTHILLLCKINLLYMISVESVLKIKNNGLKM